MKETNLRLLGFNMYESKILDVLLPGELMSVKDIYSKTKIPKNKIYETLENLKDQGIIGEQTDKPKKYFIINGSILDVMLGAFREFDPSTVQSFLKPSGTNLLVPFFKGDATLDRW